MAGTASASEPHASERPTGAEEAEGEEEAAIGDDDVCPICRHLFYRPVTTRCGHTLCESCMAHWADVSTAQMTIVPLNDAGAGGPESDAIEARCPMCRTLTTAALDGRMAEELGRRYGRGYEERAEDGETGGRGRTRGTRSRRGGVESVTVYVGNEHRLKPARDGSGNCHEWTFFVRPSRTAVVKEVQILLHPTFRQPRIVRSRPPYQVTRLGWGYFTIIANIILKAGYAWVSPDAEDAPDGAEKAMLPLEWTLDFDGPGSQGRVRVKVRRRGRLDETEGVGGGEGEEEVDDGETNEEEAGTVMFGYAVGHG